MKEKLKIDTDLRREFFLPFEPNIPVVNNVKERATVKFSGKIIELVQHTAKRDKGPQRPPESKLIVPGGDPFALSSTGEFLVTFDRIQFKGATANNGKRRAAQQFFLIHVDLFAKTATGTHLLGTCTSNDLIVRGRSPSHYADSKSARSIQDLDEMISTASSSFSGNLSSKHLKFSDLEIGGWGTNKGPTPNSFMCNDNFTNFSGRYTTTYTSNVDDFGITGFKEPGFGIRLPSLEFMDSYPRNSESQKFNSDFELPPPRQLHTFVDQTEVLPSFNNFQELSGEIADTHLFHEDPRNSGDYEQNPKNYTLDFNHELNGHDKHIEDLYVTHSYELSTLDSQLDSNLMKNRTFGESEIELKVAVEE